MQKQSPPMPVMAGSTTPSSATAVTAASAAVPPARSVSMAACVASGCDVAAMPDDQPFLAADWWRALLVTGYMTGWRISELLSLRREDLDLIAGTAITRWEDNKGDRDDEDELV